MRVMELRSWLSHVGKIVQPLESVKTKYFAVSLVMDNLSNEAWNYLEDLLIPIS
jgi:hypothetical protein